MVFSVFSSIKHDVVFFDFLRGWAAIFVFFHHAAILGGGPSFFAGHLGQEAVNLFMLASGFLIFYQCSISKTYESLASKEGVIRFYTRRFFRIAPLYYVILIVTLFLSAYLGEARESIAEILPDTATRMDRYYIDNPFKSFLLHVTFIFGFLPNHVFSTPLPDWSLGLEMQFYALFPFLFFFYRKNFPVFFTLSLIGMMGVYMVTKKLGIHYPMPGFLPLKFHNFGAGIALAALYLNKENIFTVKHIVVALIAFLFLMIGNTTWAMPLVFVFSIWFLVLDDRPSRSFKIFANRLFAHKFSKFLADISYSVYLIHLVIMLPFFAFVLTSPAVSVWAWTAYSCLLLGIVMGVSTVTYCFIELPFIRLGKNVSKTNTVRPVFLTDIFASCTNTVRHV